MRRAGSLPCSPTGCTPAACHLSRDTYAWRSHPVPDLDASYRHKMPPDRCGGQPVPPSYLVWILAQGEKCIWHGLEVPDSIPLPLKCIEPLPLQRHRNPPAPFSAAAPEPDQVAFLHGTLAVHEALATVQYREVVDEVHITSACRDMKLCCSGRCLNSVERFALLLRQDR